MNKNRLCVLAQVGAIHKLPLLLLVMALIVLPLFAEPPLIYSQVRVPWNYIARVDNEIVYARPGLWAEFALSERELFTLDCRGVPYEVVVPDLAEFYASRLAATGMGIERGRDGWLAHLCDVPRRPGFVA